MSRFQTASFTPRTVLSSVLVAVLVTGASVLSTRRVHADEDITCALDLEPNNSPRTAQAFAGPTCGSVSPHDPDDWYEFELVPESILGEAILNLDVAVPEAAIGVQLWQIEKDIYGKPVKLHFVGARWITQGQRIREVPVLSHQAVFPSVHVRVMKAPGATTDEYHLSVWQ